MKDGCIPVGKSLEVLAEQDWACLNKALWDVSGSLHPGHLCMSSLLSPSSSPLWYCNWKRQHV